MFQAKITSRRHQSSRSARRTKPRQQLRSRRLALENLESRQMLSATPPEFYVVNDATANVSYEYSASGAAQGSTALAAANSAPRGVASMIGVDKTWVIDANRNVYVYDDAGALLGSWSAGSMPGNASPQGIATDGTDVWIVDSSSDRVYRYAGAAARLSGSQTATSSFNLASGNTNPKDMVTDGNLLWIVDDGNQIDRVFTYNASNGDGTYWFIDPTNKNPTGIALDPANVGDIWISDSGTDRVYKYAGGVAIGGGAGPASSSFSFPLASGNSNPQGLVVAGREWAEAPYQVEWIKQFGTAGNDWGRGVSVDPSDNVYISGAYAAASPSLGYSPFVSRLDTDGNTVWFQPGESAPGVTYEGVRVAADALGNVFQMVGHGVDSGNNIVAPTSLRNYSFDGNLQWTLELPGEYIFNVAVDNLGYAYQSSYDVNGGNNVHVRKVEGTTGDVVWHETIDTGGSCNSSGIAIDQQGNVYVAAYTWGSALGTNAGNQDGLLMKFDNAGAMQWARQFGTNATDYAFQVVVDQFGNAYTSGQTSGSLGGPNVGYQDQFLVKHDADGNLLWSRQFGNSGDDATSASWVDPQGNVYRAMAANGALGGANHGDREIVVVKYDPSGNIRWATQLGTSGHDAPVGGITGDSQGNLYITGRTTGSLGGTNAGGEDAFLIKLSRPIVPVADLAVTSTTVSATTEGNVVTFNLSVTNNGPESATGVVVTDTLGANWAYSSASVSQGTVQQANGVITFNIGTIAVGQTVTAQVQAAAVEPGNLTNSVSIAAISSDGNLANNTADNTVEVAAAPIVVSGPITISGKKFNNLTTATFTHASGVHPANYYVATIDWGNGTTSTGTITKSGSTFTVKGSKTYATSGSYTVTTTVTRVADGPSGSMVAMASTSTDATTSGQTKSAGKKTANAPAKDQVFEEAADSYSATSYPSSSASLADDASEDDADVTGLAFDLALESMLVPAI